MFTLHIYILVDYWFADLLSSYRPGNTSSNGSTDTDYGGADQFDTLCSTCEGNLNTFESR